MSETVFARVGEQLYPLLGFTSKPLTAVYPSVPTDELSNRFVEFADQVLPPTALLACGTRAG